MALLAYLELCRTVICAHQHPHPHCSELHAYRVTFLRSGLSGQSIVVTAIKNIQFVNAMQQKLVTGEDLNLPLEEYDAGCWSLSFTYRPILPHSFIYANAGLCFM